MQAAETAWTTRALLGFWLPLASSWAMMALAQPLVAIGIGRLPDPAVQLAAYGVTLDLAVLIESPIIMLFSASVALVVGQHSYRLLQRFMLWFTAALLALFAVVAFTPLYDLVVGRVIGVPDAVAAAARPALQVLLPWVPAIAWRRFYQGPLLAAGRPRLISYGTGVRLATLAAVVYAGTRWPVLPGVVLGAAALSASVVAEALVITAWALPVIRRLPTDRGGDLTTGHIVQFYAPLAATDIMRVVSRPITTAGVARAALPELSLGAWPVANGLAHLLGSGVMAFQEMVVAVSTSTAAYRRVCRFVVAVGLVFSAAAAVVAFTPVLPLYLAHVVRLPAALMPHTTTGLRILVLLPVLLALRNLLRGALIRARQTRHVQRAMAANLLTLSAALAAGVWHAVPGVVLAAAATLAGQVVEVLALAAALAGVARPGATAEGTAT